MLWLETALLCGFFFLTCYLGTGSDEKNVKSFRSYPKAVQDRILEDQKLKALVKTPGPAAVFLSNVVTFTVLLGLLCFPIRGTGFLPNFLNALIMGQILNLFDFLVIDTLWFSRSPRTRFSFLPQPEPYRDLTNHRAAFVRGMLAFLVVALIVGLILSLF